MSDTIDKYRAAEILGCTPPWACELARMGEVPARQRKRNCTWKFSETALKNYMQEPINNRA